MKKVLIIIGSILGVLLLLLILIPVLFKDTIFRKVDEQLAKTINAEVNYDADKIGLSLLRNFPNVTASLEDFSIVGRDRFAGDTLLATDRFEIVLDLMSVISGDQMEIKALELENPLVQILVLEDGTANYDIAIEEDSLPQETDAAATEFNVGIDHWKMTNGRIIYDDRSIPIRIVMEEVDHSGSGDFTQDIFDMDTYTLAKSSSLVFDGVEYVSDKRLEADVKMEMNLPEMKFTFKENTAKLNDFAMGFDGFIAMPNDPIIFDMNFEAKENSFKSLLSLVPGMYNEDFDKIEASGELDFKGYLKGTYSETSMPGYKVALQVQDARFKYEDLPTAVENINVDMLVEDADGNPDNLYVNVKTFNMNLGNNPVKGQFELRSLEPMNVFADVDAKLNLAELDQVLKIQDLDMRGLFALTLKADGVYDSLQNQFPKINAAMSLDDAYFKTADYDIPVQDFNFKGTVVNETGKLAETLVKVPAFSMLVGENPVAGTLVLENLEDYKWDLALEGTLDLTSIGKIIELEDMEVAGLIVADIKTSGQMSAVDAGRYEQLPTSGTMLVKDFRYSSKDLPYDFLMNTAEMQFNPKSMTLKNFIGQIGSTDMQLTGTVNNYIGYALKDDEVLQGQFSMVSRKVNLNEWMTEEEAPAADTASAPMEVIEIPKNLDLKFTATISEVLYDNLTLNNMKGLLIVQNGVLNMQDLTFSTLGGDFGLSGTYDPREIQKPVFDIDFKIDQLSISRAYENFVTIRTLAPIAEKLDGTFSTTFSLSGLLGQDMVPQMGTLTGAGIIKLIDATLENSKTLSSVMDFTNLKNNANAAVVQLKDILVKAKVDDGFVSVEPFDFKVGNIDVTVGGRQGIDGAMDYRFALDVPAGAIGQAANNLLAKVGAGSAGSSTIKMNLGVGGTYEDPKVSLLGAGPGEGEKGVATTVKEAAKEKVDAEVDKVKEDLEAKRREAEEKAKAELEQKRRQAEEEAKRELERRQQQVQDSLKKKSKGVLKDLLKNR